IIRDEQGGRVVRDVRVAGLRPGAAVLLRARTPRPGGVDAGAAHVRLAPDRHGVAVASRQHKLPPAGAAPPWEGKPRDNPDPDLGSLERPGYRALAYPRPKTVSGEDRVMPAAIAVHPRDGRVFVASIKTGELFVLRNPGGDAASAHWDNYACGLFQDVFA